MKRTIKNYILATLLALLFSTPLSAYELSICAIFQNEAAFLKEWIEYHLLVGVEHFYLFNDRSSDDYQAVLEPYIREGIVELFDCCAKPGERHFHNQKRAYSRGLKAAKNTSTWLALLDLDEFICPKKVDSLPLLLQNYLKYYGVAIRWQKFGTSNLYHLPENQLLIECLTLRSDDDYEDNFITKSIVQPALLPEYFFDEDSVVKNEIDLVHFSKWELFENRKVKLCGPLELGDKKQCMLSLEEAQINHYWCKHEKYYREEKIPRKARLHYEDFQTPYPWAEEKIRKYIDLYNKHEDISIQRFVPALKARLYENKNNSVATFVKQA